MKSKWSEFESECVNYLREKFGAFSKFTHMGEANSACSDILVETRNGKTFFIEVKHTPAQCGQFVVYPNNEIKRFVYGARNRTPINPYSTKILEYMDLSYSSYCSPDTAGFNINMDDSVFYDWVKTAYKLKNVKYIISNGFILFPINRIQEFFSISAKYRVKKSGSRKVSGKNLNDIQNYVFTRYNCVPVVKDGKIIVASENISHTDSFMINGKYYMFSARDDIYEIRELSKTRNANVIFSVSLYSNVSGISDSSFIEELKN